MSHRQTSAASSRSSSSAVLMSPPIPHSPPLEFDHTSSLLAMSPPPVFSRASPPLSPYALFPPIGNSVGRQEYLHPATVRIPSLLSCAVCDQFLQPLLLPRAYKDDEGRKQQPGLRDLPEWLRESFRDRFICRIIEQVCLSETPWSNPNLSSLQRELNHAYPTPQIRLHSDDAVVVPVSSSRLYTPTPPPDNHVDDSRPRSPSEPNWERRTECSY